MGKIPLHIDCFSLLQPTLSTGMFLLRSLPLNTLTQLCLK